MPRPVSFDIFPLPLHPRPQKNPQSCPNSDVQGPVWRGPESQEKQTAGGNAITGSLRPRVFSRAFSPEDPASLGCMRLTWGVLETARICGLRSHSQASVLSLLKFVLLLLVHHPLAPCTSAQTSLGSQGCSGPRDLSPAQVPEDWDQYNSHSFIIFFFFETCYLFWCENNWFSLVCFFYVQLIISFIPISQCI